MAATTVEGGIRPDFRKGVRGGSHQGSYLADADGTRLGKPATAGSSKEGVPLMGPEGSPPNGRTKLAGSAGRGRIDYKWMVLSVTTLGALLAAIDSSIVILALPSIMTDLSTNLVTAIWVLIGYILMNTVFLITFGRLADLFGRVRMYNLGFLVFTGGSVLCAFARTGPELVVFRLLQGVGGAMLMANGMALITEAFPPRERGRAMGINAITWALGNIIGPVLGGLILGVASWRFIFLINLPVGLAGTVWGFLALHEMEKTLLKEKVDLPGAALFSLAITALLLVLTQSIGWGWFSPPIIGLTALFLAAGAAFWFWERGNSQPVLDLKLFQSRVFSFSTFAAVLQSLAMFSVLFLMVFYLQGVKGESPIRAALAILPMPVVQSVLGPVGGYVSDLRGARWPATAGLVLQGLATFVLSFLTPLSGYAPFLTGIILMGLGGGLFWSPNTSAVMGAAPRLRLGVASATLATLRQCGMVVSFALALAVAAASMPFAVMAKVFLGTAGSLGSGVMAAFSQGMDQALRVSTLIVLAAALLTWLANDRAENRRGRA
ncbi:MAG TPA: MFS transporter [Spirochaetia bacterium]|nr:MFS transporter [Spirochaetia bacterium]